MLQECYTVVCTCRSRCRVRKSQISGPLELLNSPAPVSRVLHCMNLPSDTVSYTFPYRPAVQQRARPKFFSVDTCDRPANDYDFSLSARIVLTKLMQWYMLQQRLHKQTLPLRCNSTVVIIIIMSWDSLFSLLCLWCVCHMVSFLHSFALCTILYPFAALSID